jgi:HD superfamily phosphodiesterase
MISSEQLLQIKKFALNLDWNAAFNGNSKGNRHLFRVVKKSMELSQNKDFRFDIIEASAWLHDLKLENIIIGNKSINEQRLNSFFKKISISTKDKNLILACISDNKIKLSEEAKIIKDANNLEKSGPLGIVREIWKRSQLGWHTERIVDHLPHHLKIKEDGLHTLEAKQEASELNNQIQDFLKLINKQLKE